MNNIPNLPWRITQILLSTGNEFLVFGVETEGHAWDNRAMATLNSKLNPERFPGMSPFMAAIIGFVLGESFSEPEIAEMVVSEAENLAYFRTKGGTGFDGMQSLEDLRNNWNRLLDAAGLTPEERREAVELFTAKVGIVPGTEV